MRFWVDAWDPSYLAGGDGGGEGGAPAQQSSADLKTDVEVPDRQWAPVPAPPDLLPPGTVLLVDGVRRMDARLWTSEDHGGSFPCLAASYAAGAVRCDLRAGAAELTGMTVERGLFTASPQAQDVAAGQLRWPVYRHGGGPGGGASSGIGDANDLAALNNAVQRALSELELRVAAAARESHADPGGDDLLVVDGPMQGRTRLARTIGYVKTHQRQYLPAGLGAVVTALAPGQRTPVFQLGTSWNRYTWYLRLPGGTGAPWSGVVRVECPAELPTEAAVACADLSAVTLPRFAATAYKDPRAPQNLVPIAGLEQRLRARLGDPRLLHRALIRAVATINA